MSSREAFLARVKKAVVDGNRTGHAAPLPERGKIGYLGGGNDLLATFVERCRTAGMHPVVVATADELIAKIDAILASKNSQKMLVGLGSWIDSLGIAARIASNGREIISPTAAREVLFSADSGVAEVAGLIAETGSLVIAASPMMTRSESLIVPLFIAIARADQLVPDVFDLFEGYSATNPPPSNLVLITGPSKTGDIEMKLVTGVHGPGEVHVFVLHPTNVD